MNKELLFPKSQKIGVAKMVNKEDLPVIVRNLRRIWEIKKGVRGFIQSDAAADLGWTQGGLSHYLNGNTPLKGPAVIKLANYLNVDPIEIDPDIEANLPNVRKVSISYTSDDGTNKQYKTMYIRDDIDSFYVEIVGHRHLENHPEVVLINSLEKSITGFAVCCLPEFYKENTLVAVRLKKEKILRFYLKAETPPLDSIATIWAVISMNYQ